MKKLLFLMLAAALVFSTVAGTAAAAPAAPARTVDPNAQLHATPAPVATPTPRPNVVLPGWPTTTIEADTKEVTVYFPNPEKNDGLYYLAFDLWAAIPEEDIEKDTLTQLITEKDKETEEETEVLYALLYSSGLVPPGMCLQEIELVQPVHEGSYKAFTLMQPYYMDSLAPTPNSGSMAITLEVVKPVEPEKAPEQPKDGRSTDGRVIVTPNP